MKYIEFASKIKDIDCDFTGGVSRQIVEKFQNEIGYILPDDYIDFLTAYGSGGPGGCDVLGVGYDGFNTSLACRRNYLNHGLPNSCIPILNYGEHIYCINLNNDQSYRIINWSHEEGVIDISGDFFDFILEKYLDD